jgi:hypothetical protein
MDRYGYSIFCDDIRNEQGGKLSFIGCYNGVIFICGAFSLVLPRLCVHTHIVSPASRPFSSITVRCYLPGDEHPAAEEPIETPRQIAEHGEEAVRRHEPAEDPDIRRLQLPDRIVLDPHRTKLSVKDERRAA